DAPEFLTHFMQELSGIMKAAKGSNGNWDTVDDIFQFGILNRNVCGTCNRQSVKLDPVYNFKVNIDFKDSTVGNLHDMIEVTLGDQALVDGDQLQC
ncbi:hypothetical protein BGX26_011483, partial [Mortierella sp. AD094]